MHITYFGYGSLVNVDTLAKDASPLPGRLQGWRREWRVCGRTPDGHGVCALTVTRAPGEEIRGVAVSEPEAGLASLDAREHKYRQVHGVGESFQPEQADADVPGGLFLYQAKDDHYRWGSDSCPIFQSYLDCVLQGFFNFWGEDGLVHFFESTSGWHVPVLADRDAPRYVRARALDRELTALIDALVKDWKLTLVEP
ncbi:gamma-glutamylcyclotransferase family protein [Roseibium sp. RKSG952]|uniref:gamma-glutamylcyclotransferase family protein n=1 Tax=Roseibium sp. RKSG952 TaxID=2529384 RepID=UPI0012BBA363|nr:gamma-glutamylcyclotransferase family protein [Roseibium sp. RKSG952]MTH96801.1 gamma-glutamylcyclotransferase [Roseibium sp. RKSG952]